MRQKQRVFSLFLLSPSSRRAWIEILKSDCQCFGIIFIKLPALWKHRSVPPGPRQGSFACSTQAQYPGSG